MGWENSGSLWDWDTCLKNLFFAKRQVFILFPLAISATKHNKIQNLKQLEFLTVSYLLANRIIKKLDASSFSLLLLKLYKEFGIVLRSEKDWIN